MENLTLTTVETGLNLEQIRSLVKPNLKGQINGYDSAFNYSNLTEKQKKSIRMKMQHVFGIPVQSVIGSDNSLDWDAVKRYPNSILTSTNGETGLFLLKGHKETFIAFNMSELFPKVAKISESVKNETEVKTKK